MQRFGACLLAAAVACIGLASPAHGNFVATAADPAGDAVDPSAGRDIIGAAMSYDRRSGELIGRSSFAACRARRGRSWRWAYREAIQRFEITDSELAGHRLDCVIATLSEPGSPSNVYDTAGPFELVGQPALSMRVRGVGRQFKANRPRKLKMTLTNAGDAATNPVRLELNRARGLQAKPAKLSLGAIDPGGKRTVTVKVTLSGRARDATRLKVTASAGELIAREKLTLQLRRPNKPGGGDGGADRPTQTCTRWMPDPFGDTVGSLVLAAC